MVAGVSGACSETTSDCSRISSSSSMSIPSSFANGSNAITFRPSARARIATSRPTAPRPISPSVFPVNSQPSWRCQTFARAAVIDFGNPRARQNIKPSASSATASAFAPGAFVTAMPRSDAASRSISLTPAPYREITRNRSAFSITLESQMSRPKIAPSNPGINSANSPEVSGCVPAAMMTSQP